jgi:hypothetical protein
MATAKKPQKKYRFPKDDSAHYIIFRQLDIAGVPFPYNRATEVVAALKAKKLL